MLPLPPSIVAKSWRISLRSSGIDPDLNWVGLPFLLSPRHSPRLGGWGGSCISFYPKRFYE